MARTRHHVLDTFDLRLGQYGADEVDLARTCLPVALRNRPDRTVVLDHAEEVGSDLLVRREVAVFVEDPRQLGDLRAERALAGEPRLRVRDPVLTALGEQVLEQIGVAVGDVAEELVGELAVGLREVVVGGGGGRVRERAPTPPELSAASTSPARVSAVRCWRAPLTVIPSWSATCSAVASPRRRRA